MRIAVFHDLSSGGAKKATYELIRALSQIHQFDQFSLSSSSHEFCDLSPYCENSYTFPFSPSRLFSSPFGRFNNLQRLRDLNKLDHLGQHIAQVIDSKKYDLVFIHPSRFTQAPLLIRYLQTRSIYYVHEPLRRIYEKPIPRPYDNVNRLRRILDQFDPFLGAYQRESKKLDWINTRSAQTLLTNSQFTANNIKNIYQVDAKVVYLGVDTDIFRPLNLQRENSLLSVGEISPHKGFDFIIDAASKIKWVERPVIQIIGNAQNQNEVSYLQELARQKNINLKIQIMVGLEELVKFYNQARAVVYAPHMEPFGFVPLEAMACGTPVIGVSEGGLKESIIDNYSGILTERDPLSFAQAVENLFGDSSLHQRLAANAREYVLDKWQWKYAAENLNKVFINNQ